MEWIKCSDRLPDDAGNNSIYCLVYDTSNGICVRPYDSYHDCWNTEDDDDYETDAVNGRITHWQPLPPHPTD